MSIRNKSECPYCLKQISLSNIKRHIASHEAGKQDVSGKQIRLDRLNRILKIRGIDFDPNAGFKDGTRVVWNKGKSKDTDENIARIAKLNSETQKGRPGKPWSKEQKLAQSELKKKLYREFPEKHPNRKLAGNRDKMTYPERICFDWLIANNINFKPQHPIDCYHADFLLNENIIIEIDGDYWHPPGNEYDRIRDEVMKSLGYTVYRIRAKENIINRLEEILGH